jgi:hypothetical protein
LRLGCVVKRGALMLSSRRLIGALGRVESHLNRTMDTEVPSRNE